MVRRAGGGGGTGRPRQMTTIKTIGFDYKLLFDVRRQEDFEKTWRFESRRKRGSRTPGSVLWIQEMGRWYRTLRGYKSLRLR